MDWSLYPDFSRNEFEYPGSPHMQARFMGKLQAARSISRTMCRDLGYSEIKFVINSGARNEERNRRVGGRLDSTHLYACACDIKYNTSRELWLIVKSLILAGFTRIGLGETFIHVDDGEHETKIDKDPYVMWLY